MFAANQLVFSYRCSLIHGDLGHSRLVIVSPPKFSSPVKSLPVLLHVQVRTEAVKLQGSGI